MDVSSVLLKEAQQEIAALRTDLFNTRRIAEERRQQLDVLQQERAKLQQRVAESEGPLQQLPHLQAKCTYLEQTLTRLQAEHEAAQAARKIFEQELSDERKQRAALAEQKALLEGDKSRLAKLRDDLAAQLRVAQRKAKEAEEEQLRAEDEAATLRAELAALQAQVSHSDEGNALQQAVAAASAAATQPLLEQVEYERHRAATLLNDLHAANAKVADMAQQLASLQAQLQEHHQQQQDQQHHHHIQRRHSDDAVRQQLLHLQEELSRAHGGLAHAHGRVHELQAERDQLAQQLHQIQHQHHYQHHPPLHDTAMTHPNGSSNSTSAMHADLHRSDATADTAAPLPSTGGSAPSATSQDGSGADHPTSHPHGDSPSSTLASIERLEQQVAKLKASRDRLLQQIDQQWTEIDRLSTENGSMAEELRAVRVLADNYEAQLQGALAQVDRLKDLLEESAAWSVATPVAGASGALAVAATAANGNGSSVVGGGGEAASDGGSAQLVAPQVQVLQGALLGEQAKGVELDVQLRAVAAELLRCQHSNITLGRTFLPLLTGVERRLVDLCTKAKSSPTAPPADWPAQA